MQGFDAFSAEFFEGIFQYSAKGIDMAFAIFSDILAPKGAIFIEYNGPNPFAVYKIVDPLLRRLFEGKGTHMYEPQFRWDTSEDPNPFYFIVYFERALDKFTRFRVQVKGQGQQPIDATKNGSVRLEISGYVTTEIKSATFKDKMMYPFVVAYMYSFYNGVRRRYIEMLRRRIGDLEKELRDFLKIPVRV